MKTSELLRDARRHVGKGSYVCLAVDTCARIDGTRQAIRKAAALRKRIGEVLWPHKFAHCWLAEHIGAGYSREFLMDRFDDIRKWRVRWVNKMIAEYEAKGD